MVDFNQWNFGWKLCVSLRDWGIYEHVSVLHFFSLLVVTIKVGPQDESNLDL